MSLTDNGYAGPRKKLWIVGGQSNCESGGGGSAVIGTHAEHVWHWMLYDADLDQVEDESGSWVSLAPRSGAKFGPHHAFAAEADYPDEYAFLQVWRAASPLSEWMDGQPLWENIESKWAAVTAQLAEPPFVQGLLWVHGEGDATAESTADNYGLSMTTLMSQWSALTGRRMPVILNRLHGDTDRPYTTNLRAAQAAFVAGYPGAVLVDIDDLALDDDHVHFTAATLEEVGRRFWRQRSPTSTLQRIAK